MTQPAPDRPPARPSGPARRGSRLEPLDAHAPSPDFNGLSEHAARRTMRMSVLEGAFAMVFINWTAGSVLTGYALYLGANAFQLGLLGSLPLLAQASAPFAAWMAGRAGRRKPLAMLFALLGRGAWLFAAALPLLIAPGPLRVDALLALILVSSLLVTANSTLWQSWIGDVVPRRERGRYFGFRSSFLGAIGTAANLLAGVLLDAMHKPQGFQAVLLIAVISGVTAALTLTMHAEPEVKSTRLRLVDTFTEPLKHQNFRAFLAFAVFWTFAVLTASPFVTPYFLSHLRMTFTQVAIWSTISSVLGLFLGPMWGRISDRSGYKPILALATVGAGTLLPISWMLATPENLLPIWVAAAFDSLVWQAIGPAYFNLSLAATPQANRASFLGMLFMVTGLAGFAGGLLSGPMLNFFSGHALLLGSFHWTGYHWLFALSGALRACAWLFLRGVREEGAWRTRDLMTMPVRRGIRGAP
ncbi:MAG TPA: MFS transporter [Deinococcales bacterium]|nr:MFS transporter [Deinococcales bacterium]